MLTRYDEYPVHQSPYPFSEIPVTDYNWDDGYYFGVFSAEARCFLFTGMRVSPNSDVLGGYAAVCLDGRQYTVRLSRVWRPDCDTAIGPLRYEFVEPFHDVHVALGENDSALRFDLHWLGLADAHEEAHHLSLTRGRRTTDQTRYVQAGTARGWIELEGRRFDVGGPPRWYGARDHSWGLYSERPPFGGHQRWLPPADPPAARRALRLWTVFADPTRSGFYQLHENEDGEQVVMNDMFGTPFEGGIDHGFGTRVRLVSGSHELAFLPGTRALAGGTVRLADEHGREWVQQLELADPPWFPLEIGYHQGTWNDGGSIQTYHGPGVYLEYDELDVSSQPFDYDLGGFVLQGVNGTEHLVRVRTTGPDGTVTEGLGHVEMFVEGPYAPYGFE
ncbi:MAG: hypothetical protein M5U14_09535 [Acidimicrobiia bacterium]|nr:hypothetical protein [Acidimicrobiia bacterium]